MRVDQLLVAQGLAPTRSAAQRLIARGAVRWRRAAATVPVAPAAWAVAAKGGEDVPADCELQITDDAELRWASRAGLKLEGALAHSGLAVAGCICLDVGQSTGGFTDVLLAAGAAHVVGVDVGHGQLLPRLRDDPRVTAFEGLNARHLTTSALGAAMPAAGFDRVVADLSFISLAQVLPAIVPLVAAGGRLLLLAKPQFELQPAQIGKGGLVRDPRHHAEVEARLRAVAVEAGLAVLDWFASPVTGGDGNREFFLLAGLASDAARGAPTHPSTAPEASQEPSR